MATDAQTQKIAAQAREVADIISDFIASLGYPVGLGLAPHPDSTARLAKQICEYIAAESR